MKEIDARTDEILKKLGIANIRNKFPSQVSGGQKQRCACARALVNEHRLILADEPTGALDSRSAQMLLHTFTHMNEEMHATILMVTHDAFSASYCQRILFLKDGEIFHEMFKGEKSRREFLNEILDVLALTGGESEFALMRNKRVFKKMSIAQLLTMEKKNDEFKIRHEKIRQGLFSLDGAAFNGWFYSRGLFFICGTVGLYYLPGAEKRKGNVSEKQDFFIPAVCV